MTLLDDSNILNVTSGGNTDVNITDYSITIPSTTANSQLILILTGDRVSEFTVQSGETPYWNFFGGSSYSGVEGTTVWFLDGNRVTAGKTSILIKGLSNPNPNPMGKFAYTVLEVSGLDQFEAFETSATSAWSTTTNGSTRTTGTAAENWSTSSVELAVFGWKSASSATQTWSGYSGTFQQVASIVDQVASGNRYGHVVARQFTDNTTAKFSASATYNTSVGGDSTWGLILVFRMANSPVRSGLHQFASFDLGTYGGLVADWVTVLGADVPEADALIGKFSQGVAGTYGTNYQVLGAAARNGSGGLRIDTSSSVCYLPWWQTGLGSTVSSPVFGCNVRINSATGQVVVLEGVSGSGSVTWQLLYDASTSKFGVRSSTITTTKWQTGTTPTGAYRWIEIRPSYYSNDTNVAWRLEDSTGVMVEQANTTFALNGATAYARFGSSTSQTVNMDFDDPVQSKLRSAYPLGIHENLALQVDGSDTPTVSGSTSNFSTYSSGSLTAWNATTARSNLRGLPPTLTTGVVQTATAASDYAQFPMENPSLAADRVVNAVRLVAAMLGGTGAGTGTLGIRGWDGTAETVLIPATTSYDAASPTAYTANAPVWFTKIWAPSQGWTNTKVSAAAIRMGFSTDAAPDMGVTFLGIEVATKKALRAALTTTVDAATGDQFTVELIQHPENSAYKSFIVTVPSGRSARLNWIDAVGSPQFNDITSAQSPKTITIEADEFGQIDRPWLDITG